MLLSMASSTTPRLPLGATNAAKWPSKLLILLDGAPEGTRTFVLRWIGDLA